MVGPRPWIWPGFALVALSVLGDCAASQHESSNDGVTTTSVSTAYTSGYQPSPCTCECCDGSVGSTDPECHGCASVCSEKGGQFGVNCDCVDMAETCASCEICARSSCEFEWYAMTEQPRYEQMQRCVDACAGSLDPATASSHAASRTGARPLLCMVAQESNRRTQPRCPYFRASACSRHDSAVGA
jgi:hypothetical protein